MNYEEYKEVINKITAHEQFFEVLKKDKSISLEKFNYLLKKCIPRRVSYKVKNNFYKIKINRRSANPSQDGMFAVMYLIAIICGCCLYGIFGFVIAIIFCVLMDELFMNERLTVIMKLDLYTKILTKP